MLFYAITPSDAIALSLLGAILLTLLAIGSLILVMVNNVQKREAQDHELDTLLNEIEEEEGSKASSENKRWTGKEDSPKREEWENESDWWKR